MLELLSPLILAASAGPDPEDVKAGWTALVIVLLLVAAVVVLSFSLTKQLRRAQAAKDAGAFGDPPAAASDSAAEPAPDSGDPGERPVERPER